MTEHTPSPSGGALVAHDPNIRWARKTFRLHLMCWDYRAVHEVVVGGNCQGFDNIEAAIGILFDQLCTEDKDEPVSIVLRREDGDGLLCTDDDDRDVDWLKQLVVGAEIIAIEQYDPSAARVPS